MAGGGRWLEAECTMAVACDEDAPEAPEAEADGLPGSTNGTGGGGMTSPRVRHTYTHPSSEPHIMRSPEALHS